MKTELYGDGKELIISIDDWEGKYFAHITDFKILSLNIKHDVYGFAPSPENVEIDINLVGKIITTTSEDEVNKNISFKLIKQIKYKNFYEEKINTNK